MMDHKKELMMIKELMDKLVEEMEPTSDDFDEALGRKPKVQSVEIEMEGKMPEEALEKAEEMSGEDLDGDMEMGEDPEHASKVLGEMEESPEEALKRRIMKMRE